MKEEPLHFSIELPEHLLEQLGKSPESKLLDMLNAHIKSTETRNKIHTENTVQESSTVSFFVNPTTNPQND